MASPAAQFRSRSWIVVLSVSSIVSIVASVGVVSVSAVVSSIGVVSSAAVIGAVLIVVVVAVGLAVSARPGVLRSSRFLVIDSEVVFAFSSWSDSCGCCRRSGSSSGSSRRCCRGGSCCGLLRVKEISEISESKIISTLSLCSSSCWESCCGGFFSGCWSRSRCSRLSLLFLVFLESSSGIDVESTIVWLKPVSTVGIAI